jgi:hypothetical protein
MKSRDFCYWLQGFFELTKDVQLDAEQNTKIRNHLAMVFKHEIDPSNGTPEHNRELSALHERRLADIGKLDLSRMAETKSNC